MATSPIPVTTAKAIPLEPGTWKIHNVLAAAGPTTVEISTDAGASFEPETDGVFTSSGTALIEIGRGDLFRATIQSGDTMTVSLVRGWGKS
jgi:hypothetical protein